MPFSELTTTIEDAFEEHTGKNWWKPEGREGEPEVLLRQVGRNAFHLLESFRYELPVRDRRAGRPWRWDVRPHDLARDPDPPRPAPGNSTDLASVPPWLWWLVASHGRHTRAALLHDQLIGAGDPETTDEEADRAFRIALIESEVSVLRAWLMWTAVSLATTARAKPWGLLKVIAYGVHHLAVVLSLLYWGLARYSWWPVGWLTERLERGAWWPFAGQFEASNVGEPLAGKVWIVPLALTLAGVAIWGWRWVLGVLGIALVALPTIFVWLTYLVVWLLDWGVTLVYRACARVKRLDVQIPNPSFGRPYRHEPRAF